ncbi:hypothetical protein C8J56DRAFT_899987 [Mycena floridula]|nr:hypothetical protein C8J56DRAFT_899987 [Mycena floridula]
MTPPRKQKTAAEKLQAERDRKLKYYTKNRATLNRARRDKRSTRAAKNSAPAVGPSRESLLGGGDIPTLDMQVFYSENNVCLSRPAQSRSYMDGLLSIVASAIEYIWELLVHMSSSGVKPNKETLSTMRGLKKETVKIGPSINSERIPVSSILTLKMGTRSLSTLTSRVHRQLQYCAEAQAALEDSEISAGRRKRAETKRARANEELQKEKNSTANSQELLDEYEAACTSFVAVQPIDAVKKKIRAASVATSQAPSNYTGQEMGNSRDDDSIEKPTKPENISLDDGNPIPGPLPKVTSIKPNEIMDDDNDDQPMSESGSTEKGMSVKLDSIVDEDEPPASPKDTTFKPGDIPRLPDEAARMENLTTTIVDMAKKATQQTSADIIDVDSWIPRASGKEKRKREDGDASGAEENTGGAKSKAERKAMRKERKRVRNIKEEEQDGGFASESLRLFEPEEDKLLLQIAMARGDHGPPFVGAPILEATKAKTSKSKSTQTKMDEIQQHDDAEFKPVVVPADADDVAGPSKQSRRKKAKDLSDPKQEHRLGDRALLEWSQLGTNRQEEILEKLQNLFENVKRAPTTTIPDNLKYWVFFINDVMPEMATHSIVLTRELMTVGHNGSCRFHQLTACGENAEKVYAKYTGYKVSGWDKGVRAMNSKSGDAFVPSRGHFSCSCQEVPAMLDWIMFKTSSITGTLDDGQKVTEGMRNMVYDPRQRSFNTVNQLKWMGVPSFDDLFAYDALGRPKSLETRLAILNDQIAKLEVEKEKLVRQDEADSKAADERFAKQQKIIAARNLEKQKKTIAKGKRKATVVSGSESDSDSDSDMDSSSSSSSSDSD